MPIVNQIIQFKKYRYFMNRYIFVHLKLEIASTIPASNE